MSIVVVEVARAGIRGGGTEAQRREETCPISTGKPELKPDRQIPWGNAPPTTRSAPCWWLREMELEGMVLAHRWSLMGEVKLLESPWIFLFFDFSVSAAPCNVRAAVEENRQTDRQTKPCCWMFLFLNNTNHLRRKFLASQPVVAGWLGLTL